MLNGNSTNKWLLTGAQILNTFTHNAQIPPNYLFSKMQTKISKKNFYAVKKCSNFSTLGKSASWWSISTFHFLATYLSTKSVPWHQKILGNLTKNEICTIKIHVKSTLPTSNFFCFSKNFFAKFPHWRWHTPYIQDIEFFNKSWCTTGSDWKIRCRF